MNRAKAKKELLLALADILDKDDDLFPPEVDESTLAYRAFDAARRALIYEFRQRTRSREVAKALAVQTACLHGTPACGECKR